MKKFAIFLLLTPFLCAFGAVDDTLIAFGTKGPDKYLDGTTVQDGECYALVWTKAGATFAGLAADGTAIGTNSTVVVFAPIAKDGHCPKAIFELDKKLMAQYAGGSFALYLVDTRLANGQIGGVNTKGIPTAVNGYGEVVGGDDLGAPSSVVAVTTKSAVPADAPRPTITAIKVVGDNVFLTVRNTMPYLQYAAKEVMVGGDVSTAERSETAEGRAPLSAATQGDADAEITVIAPKKGDSGFYSIERK